MLNDSWPHIVVQMEYIFIAAHYVFKTNNIKRDAIDCFKSCIATYSLQNLKKERK